MMRPTNIRRTIEANRGELEGYGDLHEKRAKSSDSLGRGRPSYAFYLNEEQALLICMFSGAAFAKEIRREIIQVYQAWRQRTVNRFQTPTLDRESLSRDNDTAEFRGRAECLDQ